MLTCGFRIKEKKVMDEFELTYLIKTMPKNLQGFSCKEIIDIYLPKESIHPKIRIRKNGDQYEITKKEQAMAGDASHHIEQTIKLTEAEFEAFKTLEGLFVRKMRYKYPHEGRIAEIDVFQDKLTGLVVVDFEFDSKKEKDNFKMPSFCLADVTQEEFIAGGKICGKGYEDIEENLAKYNYRKVLIP